MYHNLKFISANLVSRSLFVSIIKLGSNLQVIIQRPIIQR